MIDKFKDMLDFGINLKLSGPAEDKYYCQRLRYYIMEQEDFDAESENDEVIDIWFMHEKTLKIHIKDSILSFEPVTDNSYEAIMVVLSFVSGLHEIVQEDFKKLDNSFDDFKPVVIEEEEAEEDSDDFEWI